MTIMRALALLLVSFALAFAPITASAAGPCQMASVSDCMSLDCTCGHEGASDNMLTCASSCVAACTGAALPASVFGELTAPPNDHCEAFAINDPLQQRPALDPPVPR